MLNSIQNKEIKKLFRSYDVEVGYVFGSVLTKYFNKESDIDFAVKFDAKVGVEERFEKRIRLMEDLGGIIGRRADLVNFEDINSLFFKFIIIKEGECLFKKSEVARVELEFKILTEYYDFQPFLEAYNKHYVESNL